MQHLSNIYPLTVNSSTPLKNFFSDATINTETPCICND